MRRRLPLLIAVTVVAALTAGVTGSAWAETSQPPSVQQMYEWCGNSGGMAGAYLSPATASQVAKLLGISTQDLAKERAAGKSIVQIAAAKGVGEQQVLDATLAPYKDSLQLRVKYGLLTQQQVDDLAKQQTERLRQSLNSTATGRAGGPGGMMGGLGGPGGMMGGLGGPGGMMGGGYGGALGGNGGMMGRRF